MTAFFPISDSEIDQTGPTCASLDRCGYSAFDRVAVLEAVDATVGVQAESLFASSRYCCPGFHYFKVHDRSGSTANSQFLRGGDLHDLTLKSEMRLGREGSVLLQGQFERRRFPLLFSNSSVSLTALAQLTWTPEWRSR